MSGVLTGVLQKTKRFKFNRRRLLKIAGTLAVCYALVAAVNYGVLLYQVGGSSRRVNTQQRLVDKLVPGLKLGSRALQGDLTKNQAVARVGEYYVTAETFEKIAKSRKHLVVAGGRRPSNEGIARSAMERAVTEPVIRAYMSERGIGVTEDEVVELVEKNVQRHGSVAALEAELKRAYGWTLQEFRDEIEYAILRAKAEEALGGQAYGLILQGGLQNAKVPKVRAFTDDYAKNHANYTLDGGYTTLSERVKSL